MSAQKLGRPKLPKQIRKSYIKNIRMTDAELNHLDKVRGGMSRSEFIRKSLDDHITGNFKRL